MWRTSLRRVAQRCRFVHSVYAAARFVSARLISRRKKGDRAAAISIPMKRATDRGSNRKTNPIAETTTKTTLPLSALVLGLATLEFLDDRCPVAALAQQAFDDLAKRRLAAARVELPRRRRTHLGRRVGGRRGDRGAAHRREVGEVVAGVEQLIESKSQLLQQLRACLELVCRALVQFGDAELAR